MPRHEVIIISFYDCTSSNLDKCHYHCPSAAAEKQMSSRGPRRNLYSNLSDSKNFNSYWRGRKHLATDAIHPLFPQSHAHVFPAPERPFACILNSLLEHKQQMMTTATLMVLFPSTPPIRMWLLMDISNSHRSQQNLIPVVGLPPKI